MFKRNQYNIYIIGLEIQENQRQWRTYVLDVDTVRVCHWTRANT